MTGESYSKGGNEPALLDLTIGQMLAQTVSKFPERDAVVDRASGKRWTWAELNEDVHRVATGLLDLGVQKGDRVGIWAPNCAEWTITQHATAVIGAILVNINPAYRAHELAYVLNQAEISTIISAVSFKTSDYRQMVLDVRSEAPALKSLVFIGEASWQQLLDTPADFERVEAVGRTVQPDEPINIQYTSGTTGFPKGATLSHRNILNNGYFMSEIQAWTELDRVCLPVPFYHCFGMVMGNLASLSHGTCTVIPAPGFDPKLTLDAVEAEKCTVLYGVPTMFIAMLNEPDIGTRDLSTLRTGVMAGSACPIEVMKRVINEMHMDGVTICYGMTETSPVSAQTRMDDSLERRTETVGRAIPHVEIKVVDPATGETVPYGETGEYCTKGYSVMLGYWNDEEKTREAVVDGWMHTGDLATMDPDGYVNIVGRLKDMVIRGGENVYPREIEEFLYTHPDIEDVQVVGVPDLKYGEELCAWIKMKPGASAPLDAAAIKEFCSGQLAHFKIPRYVILADEFPMTVTGKVRKIDMRQASIEKLDLQEAAATKTA